uniref:RING finger protein 24-like isoform X2 n=1 Tax=Myxine glutinosa TaxID=7769 RepID=UPI00358E9829
MPSGGLRRTHASAEGTGALGGGVTGAWGKGVCPEDASRRFCAAGCFSADQMRGTAHRPVIEECAVRPQSFCFFLLSTILDRAVMPAIGFQDLPLNIYVVVFGTGVFAFILSLIFCCYLIRLRRQAQSELYGYKEVVLKGKAKKLSLQETCAVCLEDFKEKDELAVCPCKHAFHRKCLVKWLEIRNSCPMCNKAVAQHVEQTPVNAATQGEELV